MNRYPDTARFPLGRQARQLFEEQQFDAARTILELLAKEAPDNPFVRMDLAAVLHRCGCVRDSTAQLLEAAKSDSPDPQLAIQLARRLLAEGEIVAARSSLDKLEALADSTAQFLADQAHLRWMMKDIPGARRAIDRAVVAGAVGPHDHHLQAMLMQFGGEIDCAGEVLAACLQRWPSFGSAALARANLRRQTRESNHLDSLRGQLARLSNTGGRPERVANQAAFAAALFKELDDLGLHEEAWPALARCNALMREIKPYEPDGESALVDALIEVSGSLRRRPCSSEPDTDGPQPIFIVGMPRSGTTLLDRMLSSHSEIESAGEISDFVRQLRWMTDVPPQGMQGTLRAVQRSADIDLAELGERYLSQTRWRAHGRRYFVDKLPTNFRMVAHVRQALPHARILHVMRDPMDVCFSNLSMMFGNASAYSYDQHAMAHYYGQYARLRDHWRNTLPNAMLEVAYADLVRTPGTVLRNALDYCGLPFEDACLHPERNPAPVATPSSAQVREPIHARSVGRWHHYAQHLGVLREATAENG
jgi:tetratricopeptide (TPR) repeat protein